ncbi:MAG: hypothetical protein QXP52_00285 [Candidatus Aenigmatarchaeota archaeon]
MTQNDKKIYRIVIREDSEKETPEYVFVGRTAFSINQLVFFRIEKSEEQKETQPTKQQLYQKALYTQKIGGKIIELVEGLYESSIIEINLGETEVLGKLLKESTDKNESTKIFEKPSLAGEIDFLVSIRYTGKEEISNEEELKKIISRIEGVDRFPIEKAYFELYREVAGKGTIRYKMDWPLSCLRFGIKRNEEEENVENAIKLMKDLEKVLTSERLSPIEKGKVIKRLMDLGIAKLIELYSVGIPSSMGLYERDATPYLIIDPKKVNELYLKKG